MITCQQVKQTSLLLLPLFIQLWQKYWRSAEIEKEKKKRQKFFFPLRNERALYTGGGQKGNGRSRGPPETSQLEPTGATCCHAAAISLTTTTGTQQPTLSSLYPTCYSPSTFLFSNPPILKARSSLNCFKLKKRKNGRS